MRKFQATFNTDAKTALERVSKLEQQKQGQVSREAIVRVVDDALQSAMKKSGLNNELQNTQKSNLIQSIRQRVSSVSLKKISNPTSLKASAITSEVKEKSTHESSVRLSITLREEGLEWSTSETESGSIRNRLQPE
jgi:L-lactate utilization protein LutC